MGAAKAPEKKRDEARGDYRTDAGRLPAFSVRAGAGIAPRQSTAPRHAPLRSAARPVAYWTYMAKKMLIDATHAEEIRVVVADGNRVEEFDFESENKRQLAGNIYLAKVTRVEPSLQAAFVDYGGNRHGFLAVSEIHPDYYQIPVADREALIAEEQAYAEALAAEEDQPRKRRPRSRSRAKTQAEELTADDAVATGEAQPEGTGDDDTRDEAARDIPGMDVVEPESDAREADQPGDNGDQGRGGAREGDDYSHPYVAAEHAADRDDTVESVADEDVSDEIRQVRKPRPRRYKIQEVIKVRQILLVQVVKEERGNKGAALTTYLSLAGRYCVLMPNAADRKKLKETANEIDVPKGAGLIIRTAGAKRTKAEIKRDYEYLQRLWEQIRELTLKSIAPAKIYEEGDLIKRSIRDLYNREIDEVLVEGERGYRIAKDFMKMIMPSHAKNVKHYTDAMPLFARYQVESYLSSMFNPTVQLKSGGYIVIGVTEALVAIDVNSGRATKEGSIEDTATKTNLEAAEEVARQLRLRDLAGLIVIDFIDMDERKNNAAVEKRLKDKLKTDRARIQVGRISAFGLMEMSRQRLRPGMLEATTQPCPHCHGTGLLRSDDSVALAILRQVEEEGVRGKSREVLVKCPASIANYLMNQKREHIIGIEARYGLSVRIEVDPMLISPDFAIEKFKTATRSVPEASAPVVSVDSSLMDDVEEASESEAVADAASEEQPAAENGQQENGEGRPKKRRRRRRRSKSKGNGGEAQANESNGDQQGDQPRQEPEAAQAEAAGDAPAAEAEAEKPKSRSRSGSGSRKRPPVSRKKKSDADEPVADAAAEPVNEAVSEDAGAPAEVEPEAAPKRKPRARARKAPAAKAAEAAPKAEAEADTAEQSQGEAASAEEVPAPEPAAKKPRSRKKPAAKPAKAEEAQEAEKAPAMAEAAPEEKPEVDEKPKRRGWWSIGR